MSIPRSLLFVPGNRPDMLEKASRTAADALMPDMEDAVPPGEKQTARRTIAARLPDLSASGVPVVPRLNALDTGLFYEDLEAVVGPYIAGVSVGKVHGPADVRRIDDAVSAAERRRGLPPGAIAIYPWIETARAVTAAVAVCRASPRIAAVCFGAEDYSNDTGIPKDIGEGADPDAARRAVTAGLAWARSAIAAAAVAAGVGAIDTPYVVFRDTEGLAREVELARAFGFDGKFAIHPAQLDVINRGFSPTADEVETARRIVAVAEEAESRGVGATSIDGMMIDRPTIVRARATLNRVGERAGVSDAGL